MAGILKTFPIDGMGNGAFCSGPNDPNRCNEQIILAITTVAIPSGTVLGKITATSLYKPIDPAAVDGSQNFAGILWARKEINTATQKAAAVVRHQVVNGNLLTYLVTVTSPQKAAI